MYKARGKGKDTGISFPALHSWNPMTHVATIAAEVSGRRVLCRISSEDLEKSFGPSEEDPMKLVVANRRTIEAAAKKLIESGVWKETGSVVVGSRDLASARKGAD